MNTASALCCKYLFFVIIIIFIIATVCNLLAEKSVSSVSTHIRILQRYSISSIGFVFH